MSTTGAYITATSFVNLKARVKNEMLRRNGYGNLTAYAGAAYDYTTVPAPGVFIKAEHIDKIVTPMKAINPAGINYATVAGTTVTAIDVLEAKLATFEAKNRYQIGSGNDCSTYCSGTCVTSCYAYCDGCDGCSGSCWDSCGSDGCSDGCSATCTT